MDLNIGNNELILVVYPAIDANEMKLIEFNEEVGLQQTFSID